MLKSMTGYGKAKFVSGDSVWQIELRAVNSKVLDFNPRMPQRFKYLENDARKIVTKYLNRGKIEMLLTEHASANSTQLLQIDQQVAMAYFEELKGLSKAMSVSLSENILSDILRMPDVIRTAEVTLSEDEEKAFYKAMTESCTELDNFRIQEGDSLQKDFVQRIDNITTLLQKVESVKDERIIRLRERFLSELEKHWASVQTDENRFEQEMIYYIEKLDITEEIVRLRQHLKYFLDTMQISDSQGKKLNFIAQEIGREINTIGSKANDATMQHFVVNMKDELEKIKEQMLNIL